MNRTKKLLVLGLSLAIFSVASYSGFQVYQRHQIYAQQDWSQLSAAPQKIQGKIITLGLLEEKYFKDYYDAWSNTVRQALEFPIDINYEYAVKHLNFQMKKVNEGKMLHYCIFDNRENKLIGEIEIREKNETDPGQFGYWINENYWGGGRAQESLKLIINAYFRLHPETNKFNAHVRLWNERSYHSLKKFGFKDVDFFYEDGKPTRHILEYERP